MTSYRHKMLDSYCMDHVSFLQMLPTQQILCDSPDTSWLANTLVQGYTKQQNLIQLDSYTRFFTRVTLVASRKFPCAYNLIILLKIFHVFNFRGLREPTKISYVKNFPNYGNHYISIGGVRLCIISQNFPSCPIFSHIQ